MSSISIEERKSLESKVKLFIHSIGALENATSSLVHLFEPLLSGLNAKVEYSEIREILLRMDKGFEAMDKRFEAMQKYMDKRFEAMDKRFEDMQKYMDKRFEDMQKYMDKRFVMLLSFVSLAFLAMPAIITLILKFMQ